MKSTSTSPGFHTFGTRKVKMVVDRVHTLIHEQRWGWWRRTEATDKLHLKYRRRCQIATIEDSRKGESTTKIARKCGMRMKMRR